MPRSVSLRRPATARAFALLGAALVVAVSASCGDPTGSAPSFQEPVVRAYLYAGVSVDDIRLTWTAPIGTPDSLTDIASPPINNAAVTLVRGGVRYPLVKSPGDSGYYRYAGSDLTVREGDVWDFEAIVNGKSITARTSVPIRPSGARISKSTLTVPVIQFPPVGGRPDFSDATAMVRWTRTNGALYYVTVDNTEPAPVAIDLQGPFGFRLNRRIVFPPTAADSFPVNVFSLRYYGKHTVRVWRVNEEYAQLYATRQQDSRDLNEPATNIRGGLGVFSGFAADTTGFVVVRQ